MSRSVSHLSKSSPILTRVKDIMQLICHFSNLATRRLGTSRRDHGDWVAHPVLVALRILLHLRLANCHNS